MEIAEATEQDYQGILELQSRYYIRNLAPEEQKDGFLSAEFTLSQIAVMAQDLGIAVAREEGAVVGYMCASRADMTPRPPILDAMLKCLESVVFHGKSLTRPPMFVYGPVCIDEVYRGRGVLKAMFDRLKMALLGRFEVGVAFVAVNNPRSLRAHVHGLGMEKMGRFEHSGLDYYALACLVA